MASNILWHLVDKAPFIIAALGSAAAEILRARGKRRPPPPPPRDKEDENED